LVGAALSRGGGGVVKTIEILRNFENDRNSSKFPAISKTIEILRNFDKILKKFR